MMAVGEFLSVEQVAHFFGVSDTTIRRALYKGEFPDAFKVGRLWKIPQADVDAYPDRWRKQHPQVPRGELAEDT